MKNEGCDWMKDETQRLNDETWFDFLCSFISYIILQVVACRFPARELRNLNNSVFILNFYWKYLAIYLQFIIISLPIEYPISNIEFSMCWKLWCRQLPVQLNHNLHKALHFMFYYCSTRTTHLLSSEYYSYYYLYSALNRNNYLFHADGSSALLSSDSTNTVTPKVCHLFWHHWRSIHSYSLSKTVTEINSKTYLGSPNLKEVDWVYIGCLILSTESTIYYITTGRTGCCRPTVPTNCVRWSYVFTNSCSIFGFLCLNYALLDCLSRNFLE